MLRNRNAKKDSGRLPLVGFAALVLLGAWYAQSDDDSPSVGYPTDTGDHGGSARYAPQNGYPSDHEREMYRLDQLGAKIDADSHYSEILDEQRQHEYFWRAQEQNADLERESETLLSNVENELDQP